MTTAAKHQSTMRQLGALLGLLWSGRPRFGRRSLVSVVAASDIGIVRGNNEDYFLVADLGRPAMTTHGNDTLGNLISEQPVLIVADGMGGAAGGEIASGLAATVIFAIVVVLCDLIPKLLALSAPYRLSALTVCQKAAIFVQRWLRKN